MKVLIKQFLGQMHSWSVCGWGIATSLKNMGIDVHLFSTDGIQHVPDSLKENIIGYTELNQEKVIGCKPDMNYDIQISYTAPKNFPIHLQYGSKNRFGIWTYEWNGKNVLPTGFAKNHIYCDKILAPSQFSKDIFINSGVPSEKISVIPHGINKEQYLKTETVKLPTNKKFKILSNIAQNHIRKNIPNLLEVYGRSFSKNDDVCLLLKCKSKKPIFDFDISIDDCVQNFKRKYPNHAEFKILNTFFPDISCLYRSVDCVFSFSNCEGFLFPALEGIASGKVVIAPNWGFYSFRIKIWQMDIIHKELFMKMSFLKLYYIMQ